MSEEDLETIIDLLQRADRGATVHLPGGMCGAGALLDVLKDARTFRRLLALTDHRSTP